jgi:hypothetical protein
VESMQLWAYVVIKSRTSASPTPHPFVGCQPECLCLAVPLIQSRNRSRHSCWGRSYYNCCQTAHLPRCHPIMSQHAVFTELMSFGPTSNLFTGTNHCTCAANAWHPFSFPVQRGRRNIVPRGEDEKMNKTNIQSRTWRLTAARSSSER